MKAMKKLTGFATLMLLLLSSAWADRPVDETRPASPDGEISIELISGDVKIRGWDRDEVHVTGTIGDDVEELEISATDGEIRIEVELPNKRNIRDGDADLEIRVPVGSSVEAETISADLSIEGIDGAVEMESVSGDIEIEGAVHEAEVATVSGDIRLHSDASMRDGEFATVSGDIHFRGPLAAGGDFTFEAVSGDIELELPSNTSAEFSVETFSGTIDNEFGPKPTKDSKYLPAKSLYFTEGSGSANVEIDAFSGRVKLRID